MVVNKSLPFLDTADWEPVRTAAVVGRIHVATAEVQVETERLTVRRSTPAVTAAANAEESAIAAAEIAGGRIPGLYATRFI